jgi:VWFA-related protein
LDVTVTDKNGKIIRDLKTEDFEIYENGVKQNITNSSFISDGSQSNQPTAKTNKNDKFIAPPVNIQPTQIKRTIALVVDDLTLSFESVIFVRKALKKFVDEQMQSGDLVAIIRTGGGIGALQQFTSDKRILYAAIEKVRWNTSGAGAVGAFAPYEADPYDNDKVAIKIKTPGDNIDGDTGLTTAVNERSAGIQSDLSKASRDFSKNANDFRTNSFVTGSLGAIGYVVRGMKELPGRKSVMLLSDGFQLFNLPTQGTGESGIVLQNLRRLIDEANRASVVIYSMDARGLQPIAFTAQDSFYGKSEQADFIDPRKRQRIVQDRRDEFFNTQEGLAFLSKETGGFTILNTNDLSGGIRKILNDQSYYLVGYEPNDETFDPKKQRFNKIEIKVNRKDSNVRYRSGFLGISDEQIKKPTQNLTPYQQITNALTSPFAVNDISLRLNTLFSNNKKQGSYVNSLLYVNAKDLKFTDESNGRKKAAFDILAMSFGDNGTVADQINQTYTLNLKKEEYQKLVDEGFVYVFTFPVKKPGAYQMRVAVRDHATEKVGSASQFIEVPNLKDERLTLSGIVLEDLSFEQWSKSQQQKNKTTISVDKNEKPSDSMTNTVLRDFKRGRVLRYGFEIYNAKPNSANNLTIRTRIFRDGELIFEGKPQPIDISGQTDLQRIQASSAINLGADMEIGNYILQIIVTDPSAKEKNKIAVQFVQFEIVE